MPSAKTKIVAKHALPFKTANKQKRAQFHLKQKKARDSITRDERFRRKREEEKDPKLKAKRLALNVPATIDKKRTFEDYGSDVDEENILSINVDVARLKRQKTEEDENQEEVQGGSEKAVDEEDEDDADSMLDTDSEAEEGNEDDGEDNDKPSKQRGSDRASSPAASTTSTRFDLTPEALANKFPALFNPPEKPKVLVTTSLNSTLHSQAEMLCELFPDAQYIRRTQHRYGHKYSVKEISSFAHNRGYTMLCVLNEDQKRPCGLDIVTLPNGPMFHFSISNWIETKKIPGHGRDTGHYPELILNNFKTPLGLLTAHLFRTLFPIQPELVGRQVVTLHNQRDYIFFRRHRYIFREKRGSEKSVTDPDGKLVKGAEDIRAGLQELGPRFTLKLRRVDKGIQKSSGQEWKWKAHDEKVRTRFVL